MGDADPLAAVSDALHQRGFDEIIISTLPWRLSRWLRVDLPSKLRGLGVPVEHVEGSVPIADALRVAHATAMPSAARGGLA